MNSLISILVFEQKNRMKINNRHLRDTMNPFTIPDEQFKHIYRMPSALAQDFINELEPLVTDNISKIPFYLQFLCVLNFYATGCYQRRVGLNAYGSVSQSTMSRFVRKISLNIVDLLAEKYIKFPQNEDEMLVIKNKFMVEHGMPNIVGLIDGTHIALAGIPKDTENAFINRKGYHSINTQIICDCNLLILNVNARYPGSTHDSFIWKNSLIFFLMEKSYENLHHNNWLLGDSGYPLQPWLMTPVSHPTSQQEKYYNQLHCSIRNKVERCIGLLKTPFRCLLGERKLRYGHKRAGDIIYACCILHNFLLNNNYHPSDADILDEQLNFIDRSRAQYYSEGLIKRNELIAALS